jgi:hypothetical protein
MSEQIKGDNSSASQQAETDVLILIKKMQQQLVSLEKKIDALIGQSQEKPFREKSFSKPFRSFDRPYRPSHHYDKRGQGDGPRERSFRPGYHSEGRPGEERREFRGPRKEYDGERERSSGADHSFKKFGGKKSFDPRKKPFFHKRKDR